MRGKTIQRYVMPRQKKLLPRLPNKPETRQQSDEPEYYLDLPSAPKKPLRAGYL